MSHRWGPNAKEMAAIKKYLETQNVTIRPNNHPLVGGVEVDLPALYHAVQSFGGLTEVIQRKKWPKIADFLRIPKGTQDRGNKLDDIYCKFLLPYDTLSQVKFWNLAGSVLFCFQTPILALFHLKLNWFKLAI